MKTGRAFALFGVLVLLASCGPLPPATSSPSGVPSGTPAPFIVPPAPAATTISPATTASPEAAQTTMGAWRTYDNTIAGFSISYPLNWSQAEMPAFEGMQGVAFEGPEGRVELQWGMGFGGACARYSAVHTAQGQLSACHMVSNDGTQHWEQIYKQLAAASFGARAFTKDANLASADLVLEILGTLAFAPPADQAGAVPTSPSGQVGSPPVTEVVVDNADAGFRPKGNWYYLDAPEKYGPDCYEALPGLDASAEVRPDLPQAGAYEVFAWRCGKPGDNQTPRGIIEVHRSAADAVPASVGVNYQAGLGQWQSLGIYNLDPGAFLNVKSSLDGSVVADAYQFALRPERTPSSGEVIPTPLPSGPIVSNHPPSPLQQLTSGDLSARIGLTDPFYASAPMTMTEKTFDDCQAFPREGCSGTRDGWKAIVTHEGITLTYRVASDYKLVGIEGADAWLDPWTMGQQNPQSVFLSGSDGSTSFRVRYNPDNTWHLLRPGDASTPASDVLLGPDQVTMIRDLAAKYSTLYLQSPGGETLTFYGLGRTVAPTDADRNALLELGATLAASTIME